MAAYACECPCLRCRTIGGPHHTIDSTGDLERTSAELADHLEPLCRERGRMLGIMVADGEWIVSLSSVASVSQEFVDAVLDFDPDMSPIAHDWSTVPKRSLGGHDLSAWLLPPSPTAPLKGFFKVVEPTAASAGTVAARSTLPLAGGAGVSVRGAKAHLVPHAGRGGGIAPAEERRPDRAVVRGRLLLAQARTGRRLVPELSPDTADAGLSRSGVRHLPPRRKETAACVTR